MAIARCPHCRLPLTAEEVRRATCPACTGLVAPRAEPATVAAAEPARPARSWWVLRLMGEGLLVALGGAMLWYALSTTEAPELSEPEPPVPAAPVLSRAEVDSVPVEEPLDEHELLDDLEVYGDPEQLVEPVPEPPRSTAKWRAPAPWRGPMPRLKSATTRPAPTAKRAPARAPRREAAFGNARLLDRPDGEFIVPDLLSGQRVQLLGRVGTLRLGAIGAGAFLDAARLQARQIICGGPIDGRATVRLVASDGAVEFRAPIAGEAWVAVRARAVALGEVSGAARVGVVLTRGGALTFGALSGRARLYYRKLAPADPEPDVRGGPVNPDAELKRIE